MPSRSGRTICYKRTFIMGDTIVIDDTRLIDLTKYLFSKDAINEQHKNFRIQFYNLMIDNEGNLSDDFLYYASGSELDIDSEIKIMNKLADSIYFGKEKMEASGKLSDTVISRWSDINLLRTRSANFQGLMHT